MPVKLSWNSVEEKLYLYLFYLKSKLFKIDFSFYVCEWACRFEWGYIFN